MLLKCNHENKSFFIAVTKYRVGFSNMKYEQYETKRLVKMYNRRSAGEEISSTHHRESKIKIKTIVTSNSVQLIK
jgi:hypothetical protein